MQYDTTILELSHLLLNPESTTRYCLMHGSGPWHFLKRQDNYLIVIYPHGMFAIATSFLGKSFVLYAPQIMQNNAYCACGNVSNTLQSAGRGP